MAGPFKRDYPDGGWHYSGSFFWMRNPEVFRGNWKDLAPQRHSVENWPPKICGSGHAASIFGCGVGHLYDDAEWPNIERWISDWDSQANRETDERRILSAEDS